MLANHEKSEIIIAGCGNFGSYLAEKLTHAGQKVAIIDQNCKSFEKLSRDFPGTTVEGDASNIEVLRFTGINHAKIVVAATDDDNINLMIGKIALQIYEVDRIYAVVNDVNLASTTDEHGIITLCPSAIMTESVFADIKQKEG